MGKKTRKTRWRALEIGGESDSEESNTLSTQTSKSYGHRPYYSKFTYSSQSTPTRRYPHDAKSTRSSSTASETKITFNEDEYTKITTPRQDVLFKKGYLNKPKTYQTQTSTGNSTASTGNSTGNGTPDHQSADGAEGTDLEYESQFVFPNGFVDHHGVYYINSFEPYPLVMYNPPICYSEYPISRSKRHSTGSLTESTSPHNEEASQDLSHSGGETSGTVPECNQVYNVVYPGYYYDGVCGPNMVANSQASTEPRKVRKKRRRRVSKNLPQDGSTSSDDYESSDDAVSQIEIRMQPVLENQDEKSPDNLRISIEETNEAHQHDAPNHDETTEERLQDLQDDHDHQKQVSTTNDVNTPPTNCDAGIEEGTKEVEVEVCTTKERCEVIPDELKKTEVETCESKEVIEEPPVSEDTLKHSFNLNAEEFYPRAYRNPEHHHMNPNFHFVDMHHPNFIPLPFVNELGPAGFNPQFLPPGIPLGFLPHDPKLLPNFVNFVPNQFYPKPFEVQQKPSSGGDNETKPDDVPPTNPEEAPVEVKEEVIEPVKATPVAVAHKTDVDIAKIVSKLEEAAKEQILQEHQSKRSNYGRSPHKFNKLPRHRLNGTYNHPDGGYKSSYDRRGRHFDRNRRPDRPVEQNSKPPTSAAATPEPELKTEVEAHHQQPEIKTEPKERQPEGVVSPQDNSRHNSPRHVSYKNQYQSPRRFNYYNKNANTRPVAEVPQPQIVNYSETLKRQPIQRKACPRYERTTDKRDAIASPPLKKDEDPSTPSREVLKPSKTSSQWISVSNRKKRKNKASNEEEFEVLNEDDASIVPGDAEVLILTKEEEIMINEGNQKGQETPDVAKQEKPVGSEPNPVLSSIDTFIEMVASKEASPIRIILDTNDVINGDTKIVIQDVQDVEKELLKEILQDEILIAEIETPKQDTMTKTSKGSSKKKSKKGVHKLCPKRIIIKDLDFSKDYIEVKPADLPETPVLSEVQPVVTIQVEETPEPKVPQVISTPEEPKTEKLNDVESIDFISSPAVCTSTPDKKKPKKKKKTTKTIITANQSASSSSTTLNVIDESYDFLLDTSVLVDDKTNVEVSEELDRMIQRGLYGNLEEKMKSLNVSINEDFFKSLSLDTKQSTPEKGFIKATDFSSILKNANQILTKNKPESHTNNKIDIDFTKIKLPEGEPQPSTSKDCAFLELPQVKTDDEIVNTKTKSNGKLRNKSKKHEKKLPKNDEAPLAGLNNGIENGAEDVQPKNEVVDQVETSEEIEVLKNDLVEEEAEIGSSIVEHEAEGDVVEKTTTEDDMEDKFEEETEICSPIVENVPEGDVVEKTTREDDMEDKLMILEDKGEEDASSQEEEHRSPTLPSIDDNTAQTENQKHIVQSTANLPDQLIEENHKVIEEDDVIQTEEIVPVSCSPSTIQHQHFEHLTNGYTNEPILRNEEIFDSDDITINGYTKVEIYTTKQSDQIDEVLIDKDLIDSYHLPNGNCHNQDDNNSTILTNGHICEKNFTTSNSKHENGYKDNFLPEEELNGNHIEDRICCKTYETFQVVDDIQDIQEKEDGFVQITLSTLEDHQVDRKDSTGNVSDAFEATDENITSDLSTRPQKSITQAVFEWMTKTRENTPEVEILKSPDTINRELVHQLETDDSDEEDLQAIKRRSKYGSEEEITIFENWSPGRSEDQNTAETVKKSEDKVNCNGVHKVEQAEDVLEVYESNYGKNEDFLKLKAEIEEHKKKGKYSKHGDLPYRAICCSLM